MYTDLPIDLADRRRSATTTRLEAAVTRYLRGLATAIESGPLPSTDRGPLATAEQIFHILTSRPFSYMGRTQSEPYRNQSLAGMRREVSQGRPVRFYFDLGPGYHASLDPGNSGLVFNVGLAEFLALRQIRLFNLEVQLVYPAGVKFFLVIDNLCGLYTNDVPVARSLDYVRQLRSLIKQLDLVDLVEVLVESEIFTATEYEAVLGGLEPVERASEPSDEDIENIARFLGRSCCNAEAAERIERYRQTGIVTETLLAKVVDGVRLTQRATPSTLGFRSFPGGAQRIQVGEIVVAVDDSERTRPVLLTSRNRMSYDIRPLAVSGILPPAISEICYVRLLLRPDRRQRKKQ